jgi:hypothetical protein
MHAFSGTPRVASFRARGLEVAVFPGPDGLLIPWPWRTCHEQRDAILFVSETPMDLNARAPMKRDAVWLHGIRDNSYYGSHGSGLGNVCRFSKARAIWGGVRQGCLDL